MISAMKWLPWTVGLVGIVLFALLMFTPCGDRMVSSDQKILVPMLLGYRIFRGEYNKIKQKKPISKSAPEEVIKEKKGAPVINIS